MAFTPLEPIKNRVYSTSKSIPKPSVPPELLVRPLKYKRWTSTQLEAACKAVQKEGISLRQASEEYCIPKSTLHDHLSGKVLPCSKSSRRHLSDEEEKDLVKFLISCADLGYPRTRKDVISLVQRLLEEKGEDVVLSRGWWESFRKRHPDFVLRFPEQLSQIRSRSCSKVVFTKYFDLLERTMHDNEVIDKPSQIFNCDETGVPLDPKPLKAIVPKGTKHPRTVTTGDKAQITVLACCNAAGYVIPPFIVYDRRTLKPEMYDGEVPGTMYGLSDSGWINSELFENWFQYHFLPHAPASRPLLLLLDGHSSHYNPTVIKKAAQEKVVIFCLPPHSSHESQPLDKGPFGPLKAAWREVCQSFLAKNSGKVVTRFTFSRLFHEAWISSMNMKNVQGGFRYTGIFPLDRNMLIPQEKDELSNNSLAESCGLKFIPLYSPICPKTTKKSVQQTHQFSEEDVRKFQKRFEEGYDLTSDDEYNLWLKMNHLAENQAVDSNVISEASSNETSNYNVPTMDFPLPYPYPPMPEAMPPMYLNPYYLPPWCQQAPPYAFPIASHSNWNEDTHVFEKPLQNLSEPAILPKPTIFSKLLKESSSTMKIPDIPTKSFGKVLTSVENIKIIEEKEKKKLEEDLRKQERQRKAEEKKMNKIKNSYVGSRGKRGGRKTVENDDSAENTQVDSNNGDKGKRRGRKTVENDDDSAENTQVDSNNGSKEKQGGRKIIETDDSVENTQVDSNNGSKGKRGGRKTVENDDSAENTQVDSNDGSKGKRGGRKTIETDDSAENTSNNGSQVKRGGRKIIETNESAKPRKGKQGGRKTLVIDDSSESPQLYSNSNGKRGGRKNVETNDSPESSQLDENDKEIFCICKKAETDEMVLCDGENCPVGWWHFACANLKTEPTEEFWFCKYCI